MNKFISKTFARINTIVAYIADNFSFIFLSISTISTVIGVFYSHHHGKEPLNGLHNISQELEQIIGKPNESKTTVNYGWFPSYFTAHYYYPPYKDYDQVNQALVNDGRFMFLREDSFRDYKSNSYCYGPYDVRITKNFDESMMSIYVRFYSREECYKLHNLKSP